MPIYEKRILSEKAKELHVVRDTFEKVLRLRDVLKFFDTSDSLRNCLALKGGTAINLLFFNLPRLSVDIDLDFSENISREEMLFKRGRIKDFILKQMKAEGYALSSNSKTPHSLDSFVFDYTNSAGVKDNIKIEINYSLRSHVFPPQRIKMKSNIVDGNFEVNTLSVMEIYATKTIALMTRAAARDLYDINYMINYKPFDETEMELYRKCVIFYAAIVTQTPPLELSFSAVDTISAHKIKTDLKPVVRDYDTFELNLAKENVKEFLAKNIHITEKELQFLKNFKKGKYNPELLFDDDNIIKRINMHPMALWKISQNRDDRERQ